MIDPLIHQLIPLRFVPKLGSLKNSRGGPVTRQRLHAWSTRGCRGCILETTLIGGVRFTSEQAIADFLQALNAGGANAQASN